MKRILIVNNNMHIGGVQRSLLNLTWELRDKYDITLLLFSLEGPLLGELPKEVKVMKISSPYRYFGMTRTGASGIHALRRNGWALLTRIFGRKTVCGWMDRFQETIGWYDAAISFLHSGPERVFYGGCNEFVLSRVLAKKKFTFLHCDFEQIHANTPQNREVYRQFDGIAACSKGCGQTFLRCIPELEGKLTVVPNCQRFDQIQKLAGETTVESVGGKITVLTVARFGKEKGVLRAIEAIGGLAEKDRLRYILIGDGLEYARATQLIEELGLETVVELKGVLTNPYPWMRSADLLLIPSLSEAAPMVIGEAAALGTPILSTRTSSAADMVEETGYGWVCDNTMEQIRMSLGILLNDTQQLRMKREHLRSCSFDNTRALAAFDKLIECGGTK